jgi:uncharacterized phage protein gp47/JayE
MPWVSPTLKELNAAAAGDLSARLLNGAELKPNSVLSVLAAVRAGGEYNIYGFMTWAFAQIFVGTAEAEYLDRWAEVWAVVRKPPASARGLARVTGAPDTGIPAGVQAKSQDGVFYVLDSAILLLQESGVASVDCYVTALDGGLKGNLAAGQKLVLTSPLAGVNSELTVVGEGLVGGTDLESDASFRSRLLKTIQEPPHGGNRTDYENWALEVPGVEKALCVPSYVGLGTVGVIIWGGPEAPVLSEEVVRRCYDHLLELCPVTASKGLYVFTPDVMTVDFEIQLIPDTEDTRETVKNQLLDLFEREGRPGLTIPLSHFQEAISLAAGEFDHVLEAPVSAVVPGYQQLPVLGEITWT